MDKIKYLVITVVFLILSLAIALAIPTYNVYSERSKLEVVKLQAKANMILRESMIINLSLCPELKENSEQNTININN